MQRFTIQTLVDITETKQYRHQPGEELAKHQQQNFVTLLQTIGLRANPIFSKGPTITDKDLKTCNFGKNYSGVHAVWTFVFDIEYEGAFTDGNNDHALLIKDLRFVPIITGLNETIDVDLAVFDTSNPDTCNTVVSTGS
jgi:hypothetical protein